MSRAQGIRAGKAYVELGTNDSKLVAGLRDAQRRLKSFGRNMAMAGGAAVGAASAVLTPMLAATNVFATSGDELSKAADKTGASVEALSELRHAASQSAVPFKSLTTAINKQQRNLAEAASGNKEAADSFATVGLSVQELLKLSPDQQFSVIAERISQIENPALRTAAAMDIFGKSGAELLPLMIGGAAGVEALRREARALGLQVSGQDAANATLLGDTWANVQKVMKAATFQIGAALAPSLIELMNAVLPLLVGMVRWIDQNRALVVTIASIAAGVLLVGTGLVTLGGAVALVSFAIGGLITLGSTLGAVLAAVTSPMGLIIGLAAGLTYAFLQWTQAGQSVVQWWASEFPKLVTVVSETVGGMFDALASGNLALAAQIGFTGVQLVIAKIMNAILDDVASKMTSVTNWLAKVARANGMDGVAAGLTASSAMIHGQTTKQSKMAVKSLEGQLAAMTAAASKQREEQAIGVLKIGGMEFDVEDFLGGLEMAAAGGGGAPAIPDRSDPAFGTFSAAQATRFVGADPIQSAMLEELRGIHRENKKRKRIEVDE